MRKTLCILLCLALMLGILGACGSTAASTAASAESASAEAAGQEGTPADDGEPADETSYVEPTAEEVAEEVESYSVYHELPFADADTVDFSMFEGMNPNLMAYIDSYEDAGIFKWLEETTGIHVSIPAVHPASQNEQFALMMASGDWADFMGNMTLYQGGLDGALDEDIIYDLNEFEEQMPLYFKAMNLYEDAARDCRMDSGAIAMTYMIYTGDYDKYTSGPMIRTDWLDELGLELPHTYDEYYEVLTAFKNEKNAVAWFSGSGSPFLCQGYNIAAGYGFGWVSSLDCWYQIDGQVQCGFLSDSFKDYLTMMQKWYTEGLIYEDFFTNGTNYASGSSDAFADVTNGKIGVWTEEAKAISTYADYDIGVGATYYPILGDGEIDHMNRGATRVNQSKYAIATNCENPQLAAEWLDVWYSSEATVAANWGTEGESFEYDADGNPVYTDLITNNPDGISMSLAKDLYTAPTGGYLIDARKETCLWGDLEFACEDIWGTDIDGEYNMSSFMTMTADESAEYSALAGDLITYVSTELAKFITGEKNLEGDLDTFIQTIKDMGIQDCIDIQQATYDRYLAR